MHAATSLEYASLRNPDRGERRAMRRAAAGGSETEYQSVGPCANIGFGHGPEMIRARRVSISMRDVMRMLRSRHGQAHDSMHRGRAHGACVPHPQSHHAPKVNGDQ